MRIEGSSTAITLLVKLFRKTPRLAYRRKKGGGFRIRKGWETEPQIFASGYSIKVSGGSLTAYTVLDTAPENGKDV